MTAAPMRRPSMWKWTNSSAGEVVPDTAFADAFLRAILEWAAKHAGARRVALPSQAVDAAELRKVVCALVCAQNER